MRNPLKSITFAGALAVTGAVTLAPATLLAQDSPMREAPEMTPEQKAQFDSWPAEQQRSYMMWPTQTQDYYWTLAPERQAVFWQLRDEDKIALTAMTGPEREAIWEQIEARESAAPSSS